MVVAAALGSGVSVAVGSCGGEDRGSVEVETSGTGASTTGTGTSPAPTAPPEGPSLTTSGAPEPRDTGTSTEAAP